MLKNEWTEAWEAEDSPDPLPMPLQNMVTMDAIVRTQRYAASPQAQAVSFNPVGQVVGMMNEIRSTRELIVELVEGYVDAVDRLNGLSVE
jgi:NAD(P)H-dependent flavin oxidoreductase YrpB (nitropropane dioxygenase family)